MVDWGTVIASVSVSGGVATAVVLFFKRAIERVIDVRIEKLMEQNRALIQEEMRQKARVFDDQYGAMRGALALVYRLRNEVREFSSSPPGEIRKLNELLERLHSNQRALEELLYYEKHIMPLNIAFAVHEVKKAVAAIVPLAEKRFSLSRAKGRDSVSRLRGIDEQLQIRFQRLDHMYEELDVAVRAVLKIEE